MSGECDNCGGVGGECYCDEENKGCETCAWHPSRASWNALCVDCVYAPQRVDNWVKADE